MKTTKRFFILSLAVILGVGGAFATALAQGDNLVTVCFRNRTIQIPNYLVARYMAADPTFRGEACPTTPVRP